MKSKINLSLLLLILVISCAPMIMPTRKLQEEPIVRILLHKNPGNLELKSDAKIRIKTGNKNGTVGGRISIRFVPSLKALP